MSDTHAFIDVASENNKDNDLVFIATVCNVQIRVYGHDLSVFLSPIHQNGKYAEMCQNQLEFSSVAEQYRSVLE